MFYKTVIRFLVGVIHLKCFYCIIYYNMIEFVGRILSIDTVNQSKSSRSYLKRNYMNESFSFPKQQKQHR